MPSSRTFFIAVLITALLISSLALYQPAMAANPSAAEELAHQLVALTNAERAQADLPPLKYQPNLRDAAMWMAQDMADKHYFSHTDSENRSIGERIPAFGYTSAAMIAENISAGYPSPEATMEAWMQSDGHRANILRSNIREMGAGYGYHANSQYGHYWVQDFGARSRVFPLIINGEAITTDVSRVELYVYGEGWAQEMRLSNDGSTWTDWQSYRSIVSWELLPATALATSTRTVYVELRKDGDVRTASDSIELSAATSTNPGNPPTPSFGDRVYLPFIATVSAAPVPRACTSNAQATGIETLLINSPEQRSIGLHCNDILAQVAQAKASDMANRNYFNHVTPEGFGPNALVQQAGYALPIYYGTDPQANYIESLAAGRSTSVETWNQWMSSDSHRQHLLGLSDFYATQVEYGIGYAYNPNSQYRHYWVVLIAEPGP